MWRRDSSYGSFQLIYVAASVAGVPAYAVAAYDAAYAGVGVESGGCRECIVCFPLIWLV